LRTEYRLGFPDFMDLLVVSSDAGLSIEAALDRVRGELSDAYPSFATNIHMTNLEIRAGRGLTEALEQFAERLGLDEAHSFATLIKQSDELGSSIGDTLRVYSDDMRHKRLSRAEEKAHSLPAKLTIPMMVCVFPVLFIVILCPVIVRLATNNW
jgi:tight adherence protein C